MFKLIKQLQDRPEEVRRRVGGTVAGIITLVIVLIWFSTLGTRVEKDRIVHDATPPVTPFSSVRSGLSQGINDVFEQIWSLRSAEDLHDTTPESVFSTTTETIDTVNAESGTTSPMDTHEASSTDGVAP